MRNYLSSSGLESWSSNLKESEETLEGHGVSQTAHRSEEWHSSRQEEEGEEAEQMVHREPEQIPCHLFYMSRFRVNILRNHLRKGYDCLMIICKLLNSSTELSVFFLFKNRGPER